MSYIWCDDSESGTGLSPERIRRGLLILAIICVALEIAGRMGV